MNLPWLLFACKQLNDRCERTLEHRTFLFPSIDLSLSITTYFAPCFLLASSMLPSGPTPNLLPLLLLA